MNAVPILLNRCAHELAKCTHASAVQGLFCLWKRQKEVKPGDAEYLIDDPKKKLQEMPEAHAEFAMLRLVHMAEALNWKENNVYFSKVRQFADNTVSSAGLLPLHEIAKLICTNRFGADQLNFDSQLRSRIRSLIVPNTPNVDRELRKHRLSVYAKIVEQAETIREDHELHNILVLAKKISRGVSIAIG